MPNTGGTEWFISPGIFWTKRNFAIKAGVQIPIASSLNGAQDESDLHAGLQRGEKVLFDLVGGVRFRPTGYLEADTVWLLELNGEYGDRADINGTRVPNTGGTEWFISPGIFWTKRNFAIKAGVQIPIVSSLNGAQDESDLRANLTLEWHL